MSLKSPNIILPILFPAPVVIGPAMFPPPLFFFGVVHCDAAVPHIWVISRGDAGIESGVVGYWYPDSEQLVEWSYECERGGVCSALLGPVRPIRRCAGGTYMRI